METSITNAQTAGYSLESTFRADGFISENLFAVSDGAALSPGFFPAQTHAQNSRNSAAVPM
jgi:hypothetical protein